MPVIFTDKVLYTGRNLGLLLQLFLMHLLRNSFGQALFFAECTIQKWIKHENYYGTTRYLLITRSKKLVLLTPRGWGGKQRGLDSLGGGGAAEDGKRPGERHLHEVQRQSMKEGDVWCLRRIIERKASNHGETCMPSWRGEPSSRREQYGRAFLQKEIKSRENRISLILFSFRRPFTPIKRPFISTV